MNPSDKSPNKVKPRVCGLGLASVFGLGKEAHLKGIRGGQSLLAPLEKLWGEDRPWGSVKSGWIKERHLLNSRRNAPATQLAILLAKEAVAQAGWSDEELSEAALIVGSSRGNASGWLSSWEGRRPVKLLSVPNSLHSELASGVTIALGIHGPYHVLADGCAAGLDAVGMAAMLMECGVVKRALAIGLDLPLCCQLLDTYWQSKMLSQSGGNDPYSLNADGMNISEGGAAIALEMSDASGVHVQSYRVNSDAHGPLGMPEDGKQLANLLGPAVEEAQQYASGPVIWCPHASGTANNSKAETAALKAVFHKYPLPDLRMMKPWVGHTIGGSGILELACILSFVEESRLPANPSWVSAPLPEMTLQGETVISGKSYLIKTASSMGGHNVVLGLSIDTDQ